MLRTQTCFSRVRDLSSAISNLCCIRSSSSSEARTLGTVRRSATASCWAWTQCISAVIILQAPRDVNELGLVSETGGYQLITSLGPHPMQQAAEKLYSRLRYESKGKKKTNALNVS